MNTVECLSKEDSFFMSHFDINDIAFGWNLKYHALFDGNNLEIVGYMC